MKRLILIAGMLLSMAALAACQPAATPTAVPTPVPPTAAPTATPAPTPTPAPRTLSICLGQEPQTLYPYGSTSRSTWSVLEAIYDGPVDTAKYGYQPVILEKIPSLQDGTAKIEPVKVRAGDSVVNAAGDLTILQRGVKVLPAGCTAPNCAVTWDGTAELQMDRLQVTFKLLPGIKWSDGTPLTANDSLYAYQLAADPATQISKHLVDSTESYKVVDDLTVQWTGRPGFYEAAFPTFFFSPLPKQVWGAKSAADLMKDDMANRSPLGWGPYVIQEWKQGDHIRLKKNPNYFKAAQGLPKFDVVVYRFLGEQSDNNLAALLSGECDIVDQSTLLQNQLSAMLELQKNKKLKVLVSQGPEVELLNFGIKPVSYDDGYNPLAKDRPDLYADARTRQAFAYCLDRSALVNTQLFGQSEVPNSYYPSAHPAAAKDLPVYAYDPAKGAKLLDEVGWKDLDNNPATPRQAKGVRNVPDGTPLSMTLVTSNAQLRRASANQIAQSLATCGIQVNIQGMETTQFYAAGPDGVLFGRHFDLAQFSWKMGDQAPCLLYTSGQMPKADNHWFGANITGYAKAEFDAACDEVSKTRSYQAEYAERQQKMQKLFAQELPAIPLYFQLKIAATRPDLCGVELDGSSRSELWNIESIDYGASCPK